MYFESLRKQLNQHYSSLFSSHSAEIEIENESWSMLINIDLSNFDSVVIDIINQIVSIIKQLFITVKMFTFTLLYLVLRG